MKSILQFSCAVAMLGTVLALRLPAATTGSELALRGTFTWSNEGNQKHDLHAKLTPAGTNEWQAVWNFKWKERPMTFTGSVKGNLRNGPITGTGDMGDGKRRFTVEGTAKDGAITFEHYEVTHGKKSTGTGELRLAN